MILSPSISFSSTWFCLFARQKTHSTTRLALRNTWLYFRKLKHYDPLMFQEYPSVWGSEINLLLSKKNLLVCIIGFSCITAITVSFKTCFFFWEEYFFLYVPGFEDDLVGDVKSLFSSRKLWKGFLTVTAGGFSDWLIFAASTPDTVDWKSKIDVKNHVRYFMDFFMLQGFTVFCGLIKSFQYSVLAPAGQVQYFQAKVFPAPIISVWFLVC